MASGPVEIEALSGRMAGLIKKACGDGHCRARVCDSASGSQTAVLGEPTIADAICDRLVHNSHVLALRGSSVRRQKRLKRQPETTQPPDCCRSRRSAPTLDRIVGLMIASFRNG